MLFEPYLSNQPLADMAGFAENATPQDVEAALGADRVGLEGFLSLLSPAAANFMEPMAMKAKKVSRERFGRTMQLYAPLYISNECVNSCLYCGFRRESSVGRTTLTDEEIFTEAQALNRLGIRHLLLVSGEAPRKVPVDRLEKIVSSLRDSFPSISLESYPLGKTGYSALVAAGVDGLALYQETYDRKLYAKFHPAGPKADYSRRIEAVGLGAAAGMRRIGIGALLGLGSWRKETAALAVHALWLQKNYWRSQVCVSFPRIRPAPGGFQPPSPVSDLELAQMIFALRLLLPDAGLILSTREPPRLRDGLSRICITHMSAGSCTEPGGYTKQKQGNIQFAVGDARSPEAVARQLTAFGLDPVWKDWDASIIDAQRR